MEWCKKGKSASFDLCNFPLLFCVYIASQCSGRKIAFVLTPWLPLGTIYFRHSSSFPLIKALNQVYLRRTPSNELNSTEFGDREKVGYAFFILILLCIFKVIKSTLRGSRWSRQKLLQSSFGLDSDENRVLLFFYSLNCHTLIIFWLEYSAHIVNDS